jgi:site-specific DNA-methyltransferase (adenine-specific)
VRATLYQDGSETWGLVEGEALAVLAELPEASVDAVVTDPPYGLGFRGEAWDRFDAAGNHRDWTRQWAAACRRVLKPGGYLLAFGAPRTFHHLVAGIEDASLEIRDQVLWLYAQGVPKSRRLPNGQGTALKPAYEPILLARKPPDGNLQRTLDEFGTGALNIDAGRTEGYWPANLATSHASSCGETGCGRGCPVRLIDAARPDLLPSRLFFCAKAGKAEREADYVDIACARLNHWAAIAAQEEVLP